MTVYKLKVVKRPLAERPPDVKPSFPKFGDLHLELLENKKKLKPGLPLIPIKKVVKPPPPPQSPSPSPQPSPTKKGSDEYEKKSGSDLEDELLKELGADPDFASDEEYHKKEEFERSDDERYDPPPQQQHKNNDYYEEDNVPPVYQDPPLSPEEQEEEDRKEYLIKFKILKRQYKNFDFPVYTEHTPAPTLKRMYDDSFKMITLDENVNNYKNFLLMGFLGIEMLATKVLGLDFKGFAKIQMTKMEKYERLLVELGEKSYSNFANNWPVEVRLVGILLMDACVFYMVKMAQEYAGDGMLEMISMVTGMPITKPVAANKPQHRMRGPSMRPEDIRKMANQ